MPIIAETIRAGLLPFLLVTGGLLLLLVGHIVILHGAREIAFRPTVMPRSVAMSIVSFVTARSGFSV